MLLESEDGLVFVTLLLDERLIHGFLLSQLLLQLLDFDGLDQCGAVLRRLLLLIFTTDFAQLAVGIPSSSLIIIIFFDLFDASFGTFNHKVFSLRLLVRFLMSFFLECLLNKLFVGTFDVREKASELATILINELLEGLMNVVGGRLPWRGRWTIFDEL